MYKTMEAYVSEFTQQLREALNVAQAWQKQSVDGIQNVLICGLGGSGIGATIVSQLISDRCPVPVSTSKEYAVPVFVNKHTLVIANSYSGNTEETIAAVEDARERRAHIVCIASGGKLIEMAKENGWPHVLVPAGIPPRAAFAYSFVQLFAVFEAFGFLNSAWRSEVKRSADQLDRDEERIRLTAHQLAESIGTRIPVIYSAAWLDGVAVRWRQQINENSKALAWTQPYPEMNHNELVGWRSVNHQLAVIFLTSDYDHERVTRRMELTEEVYRKYTPHVHYHHAMGESALEQALYLIHVGDWVSEYLAKIRGFDSVEVQVIDWLKGELAKF